MTSRRWRQVEALLDVALTRPPAEWSDVLDEGCGGDLELRAEVEGLLSRLTAARERFESPPPNLAAAILAEAEGPPGSYEGRRLGSWLIVEEIGRGGMSRVFLAERADGQYEQRVAVKLLRPGLDSPIDRARFQAERQILATLDHPNISRLLDGGVTEDGLPWIAIELVDGEPIDRYCQRNELSVRERLVLFSRVIAAVQHAHQHLVVHRDLKPSNILVTSDGAVKLLDFGVAKLLEPGSPAGGSRPTATSLRWKTPEYAAPEQVRGGEVTTFTDVWQLGVVLFELLTGRLPFGERGAVPFALEEEVLYGDPPAPSSLVSLPRPLRADLDAIVLEALRKEPGRRYPSAAALLDDLTRLLDGRPVRARPDSAGYRLRKFVRRNRVAVAAGSAAMIALLGATAFSIAQMQEARRQRDVALAESRRNAALVNLQSVLAGDPRGPGGRFLSMRERIALGAQVLERAYRHDPALVVEVMVDLSGRLYDAGDLEEERRLLERAGAIASDADEPASLALAECRRAHSLVYDDLLDSARVTFAAGRAALARAPVRDPDVEAICHMAAGQLHAASGDPEASIASFNLAIEALADDPQSELRLSALHNLALGLRAAGRTREANRHHRRILEELDSTGYVGTDLLITQLSFVTSTQWELGELAATDSLVATYVRRLESDYGEGAGDVQLTVMRGLSQLRLGALDSAEVWLERGARDTTAMGRLVGASWLPAALTQLYLEQGRLPEATRAAATLPLGTPTREMNIALFGAGIRRASGDGEGAWAMLDSALRATVTSGRPAAYLSHALVTAAEWHLADGDPQAADSIAQIAVAAAAIDSLAYLQSGFVGRAEIARARAAVALADIEGARHAVDRALPALDHAYGPTHPYTLQASALRDSLPR